MYRLANSPADKKIIRNLVSDQLADCIETLFGPLNEEGHFNDINRIKEFMVRNEYMNNLVDKTYSCGTGLLKSEKPWTQIIKNRYEDMLLKIKDQRHEYTFNEMGEGLLSLIINFFDNCDYEYLLEYEDTNEAFDEDGLYIPILERKDYHGLYESLIKTGRNVFDDVVLECEDCEDYGVDLTLYQENPNIEEQDRKTFSEYYAYIWFEYFISIGNLDLTGYECTDLFEMAEISEYSELAKRWNDVVINDVLFWDSDFLFVLPLLNNKNEMNTLIKNVGAYMGYKIDSADMAALSTDDSAFDI